MISHRHPAIAAEPSTGRALTLTVFAMLVTACSTDGPPCPFAGSGDTAPSAGCFATSGGGLLVVQGLDDRVSLPGGSSQPGESAQCTAFRETWEETGLALQPGELLTVFDTGFHLYRCEPDAGTGEINPPTRFEVKGALFLSADRFGDYPWRYKGQSVQLKDMLAREARGQDQHSRQ